MKKAYSQPIWKVMIFKEKDVITASDDGEKRCDPYGLLDKTADGWNWES